MSSTNVPSVLRFRPPQPSRPKENLLAGVSLIGLLGCTQVSPVLREDMSAAQPDLEASDLSVANPDLASPFWRPDPTASIALPDCTAASLIQAIRSANDELSHPGPDIIALRSGCVYTLLWPDNWWYGPTGLPAITSDITIRPEAGGSAVVVERDPDAPKFRLFYVNGAPTTNVLPGAGRLTLQNLTLRNGLARGGNGAPVAATGVGGGGGGGLGAGGAIFAQGEVTLNGVTITGNTAVGGAGATGPYGGSGGGMGGDGGPMSSTLIGSGGGGGMKDNGGSGAAGAAGNGGDGPLPGSGGKGGSTGAAGAGGIAPGSEQGGPASTTAGGLGGGSRGFGGRGGGAPENLGDGGGGGQLGPTGAGGGGGGFGGNGGAGVINATNNTGGGGAFGGGGGGGIGNNTSSAGGGGGVGGGGGSQRGAGGFGGGGAGGGGTPGAGGGGSGGFGGGGGRNGGMVFGGGPGSATITNAESGGGGGAGLGGAVFLMYGSLTVVNSTLSGNTAQGGSGGGTGPRAGEGGLGLGGAVFNLNGTATFIQATLASNVVANGTNGPPPGNNGSAVYVLSFGKDAPGTTDATATLTLANSILADTLSCGTSTELALVADQRSGAVEVQALRPNLVETHVELSGATFAGVPILGDPGLDDLKPNGGPTATKTLHPASPARDAGDLATCTQAPVLGRDQRGQSRGAARCNLGAAELQALTQPTGCVCTAAAECSSDVCASGLCQ